MPIFDIECPCGARYEAITTTAEGARSARACPACGDTRVRRLPPAVARPFTSMNPDLMGDHEIQLHLDHRADIEQGLATGRLELVKECGPREFRPRLPRRLF